MNRTYRTNPPPLTFVESVSVMKLHIPSDEKDGSVSPKSSNGRPRQRADDGSSGGGWGGLSSGKDDAAAAAATRARESFI